ncbi:MAG: restriction endonuclease subunit S [Lachnospira sp.]
MSEYEMISSGFDWLGDIPSHWSIVRGKNILQLMSRAVYEDDEVITCFRDGEVTLRKNRRESGYTVSMKETGYQGIEKGDLVVHGMDGFAGAIGISDSRGKGTPVLNVMQSEQNKTYLMFYLRALAYKDFFMSLSTGIRIRSCDLGWNKIANLQFLVPPTTEQDIIADYLSKQVKKIEKLISEATSTVEKYKELRTSLVYECTRFGLDSDRELKDSGITWIGEIPISWEVKKVKYISKFRAGVGHENSWDLDGKYVIVNSRFVSTGGDARKYTEDALAPLYEGDICIVLSDLPNGRALSRCYYVEQNDRYTLNQRVGAFYDYEMNGKYFSYVMDRNKGLLQYDDGTNQTNLKYSDVLNCYVTVPPKEEQKIIADYLDDKCSKIDKMIIEKESLISALEEYKMTLVYEVVTGKRKVV